MNPYITVIGGCNIDITGKSANAIKLKDSNTGKLSISAGGVGRNIAENLCRLNVNTIMLTAISNDVNGEFIINHSKEIGLDMSHVLITDKFATSVYVSINNNDGDMFLGINDMEICSCITDKYISENLQIINNSDAIVIDTNLPEKTISYIANNAKKPIFADTVSFKKAKKLVNVSDRLHTIKTNTIEAEILSGIKIESISDAKNASKIIVSKGTKNVFITLGSKGVVFCNDEYCEHLPCFTSPIVNASGCGDTFASAIVYGYINGLDIKKSAEFGLAAASICISSVDSVSKDISVDNIKKVIYN